MLTLAQAAAMTGMNRSSILRAIKRGAITGTKDHNDVWHVDGAELARAFPVTPPNAQVAPQDAHPDALAAYKLALAEERITELKERLEEMKRERDRAQAGEDAWKAQCEAVTRQLALPAPQDAQPTPQPASPPPAAAITPAVAPEPVRVSAGMAPVHHSASPAKRRGWLQRWRRTTG